MTFGSWFELNVNVAEVLSVASSGPLSIETDTSAWATGSVRFARFRFELALPPTVLAVTTTASWWPKSPSTGV